VTVSISIAGSIPQWLQGEVLRNGPGEFDLGETTFNHYFDGHALLHRFVQDERLKVTL